MSDEGDVLASPEERPSAAAATSPNTDAASRQANAADVSVVKSEFKKSSTTSDRDGWGKAKVSEDGMRVVDGSVYSEKSGLASVNKSQEMSVTGTDGKKRDTVGKAKRKDGGQKRSKTDASVDSAANTIGEVQGRVVCNKYRLGKVLGKGSFGIIHIATDMNTQEEVAIKIESKMVKVPQLMYEARIYRQFTDMVGFPKLRGTGEDESSRMIVIDLLGSSLEDLFDICARRFTLKTVLMLADQLILRVQALHSKGVVHRDMKPDNFLMGTGKNSKTVFMIDFGLSKIYMDPTTGKHVPQREKRISDLVGTARYCSIRSHLGQQLSRRDDLESLCHVLVYLAVPGLPWQGLQANSTKEKYDKIGKLKQSLSPAEICEGLPSCFERFLHYSRNLEFEEEPDYDMCRGLFRECFQQYRIPDDGMYDWTTILGKGLLTVGVIGARNLLGKNSGGLSNPYCTVWVSGKAGKGQEIKEKTKVMMGSLTPLWESLFEFPISDSTSVLSIYVWSQTSRLFRDKFLGRVVLPIETLTDKVLWDDWHALQKRSARSHVAGDVHLRIYLRKGHP